MSEPMLRMAGVKKTFPGVVALDGVDLTVNQGEVMGVLGENGAGKSTLMNILFGLYTMDSGTIEM
ncbi:MAG: ATP-binding cassette domain-containing protein, partial [Nitrososphaerota archaeon]|nr:ATP-binding cassette domain-containing protein [Nitrososphaerota archaeon]